MISAACRVVGIAAALTREPAAGPRLDSHCQSPHQRVEVGDQDGGVGRPEAVLDAEMQLDTPGPEPHAAARGELRGFGTSRRPGAST